MAGKSCIAEGTYVEMASDGTHDHTGAASPNRRIVRQCIGWISAGAGRLNCWHFSAAPFPIGNDLRSIGLA